MPARPLMTRELRELADLLDLEASTADRPYTLEAIATRLRQLADQETTK